MIQVVATTALIFLLVNGATRQLRVTGSSMEPGLQPGDWVLVDRTGYLFSGPERGDIIDLHFPQEDGDDYIKRLIALPGDTIQLAAGRVFINGHAITEPYVRGASPDDMTERLLGGDQYFVMGDNRAVSKDSRQLGVVHRGNLVGPIAVIHWPPRHWRRLSRAASGN